MNIEEIKNIKFYCRDLDRDLTIREYLIELLYTLWNEGEDFSGKRPFGNSGWEFYLYEVLLKHKVVGGSSDEDGYIESIDRKKADKIIFEVIKSLK